MYRKWRPSGRNFGQRWVVSVFSSSVVTGLGTPPDAGTLKIAERRSGENRITSLALQLPPRPVGASARTCGEPPRRSTFFSLPSAKKPMYWPSGDQNG